MQTAAGGFFGGSFGASSGRPLRASVSPMGQGFLGAVQMGQGGPKSAPAPSPRLDHEGLDVSAEALVGAMEQTKKLVDAYDKLAYFIGDENARKALDQAVSALDHAEKSYQDVLSKTT